MSKIVVIIPAYNEEGSIANVIHEVPNIVSEIIVVNNNSTDLTAEVAKKAGATVLYEKNQGYGYACLKGIAYLDKLHVKPDIVVFLDGDYSDYPEQLTTLVAPIIEQDYDFVIGSRNNSQRAKKSMTPQQVFGNWLATTLIKLFFHTKFTDLGPFRAIKYASLLSLNMEDKTYGWTVEMQLKAIKHQLKFKEVSVKYRARIGVSKVSGTLKGSVLAGVKILTWIFKYGFNK